VHSGFGSSLRFVLVLSLLLSLLFLCYPLALGQDSSTGAIRGVVEDTSGARVPGADITVRSENTGLERRTISDSSGNFAAQFLPPGVYVVIVEAEAMQGQRRPDVRVELGAATEVLFQLRVAEKKETITVTGDTPAVETQASGVSSLVDERAIRELPINGRRFSDLALLTPGVNQDPRGQTSASNGDLSAGGVRGFQTSYLVDGADNNNGFFAQARGRYRAPYQFSNEVVQEFRVASSGYSAEQGRAAGAVVNVVTKSGGNSYHGTGFYFLRDSAFNATQPTLIAKPADRQQQFGFTVGGPIQHNRTFFFGGFDQHIFHVPTVVRFSDGSSNIVPTPTQGLIQGDYDDFDKDLVLAAAARLSGMAGNFKSALLGNAGFLKLDTALNSRHQLSARLSTSSYWGNNNVFFDPASPVTNYAISSNGEEMVTTRSAVVSLTSALNPRLVSHLRTQFSQDFESTRANSGDPNTVVRNVISGFGRANILPRQTNEQKWHWAETLNLEGGRHSWKFGGDALLTRIANYFPSIFGGEYIFDHIKVDRFTFQPETYGAEITALRAYAHNVPRYYIQNFGPASSRPDTNEYSLFAQDTLRLGEHLALSLGLRYDLQAFRESGLKADPLWPQSGRVPNDANNFAPRVGVAWSLGNDRPVMVRAGYGIFYARIPQMYTSALATDNGVDNFHLILDNKDYYDHLIFPTYPNPLINCAGMSFCAPPPEIMNRLQSEVASFTPTYRTPQVQQTSLSIEKELARRLIGSLSYLHAHGQNLIRSRDVNLPLPNNVDYPVYDENGINLLGYYNVDTFSTWQMSQILTCPFPPCINPLVRPIPQLGAINVFETAGSSFYDGATVALQRRMTHGLYFRLGYTFARASDDGQDALVAGRPASVQNTTNTKAERAPSVTDQRHRFVVSWIVEPHPFSVDHATLAALLNHWKMGGVFTFGSGRPFDARVAGDPNQDNNSMNDRLPGIGRNALVGPAYSTMDLRLSRQIRLGLRTKLELMAESFNLFNHLNRRVQLTDDGFQSAAAQFLPFEAKAGSIYFPGQYRRSDGFAQARDAYAARQMQLALRFIF
jgi:hypothetical protein